VIRQRKLRRPLAFALGKKLHLVETARVADAAALKRAESRSAPYDPLRINELSQANQGESGTLPEGAREDIPLRYLGLPLQVISESGARLLLIYGPRYLVVVSGKYVESVIDFDAPSLKLTRDERAMSDVHHAVYHEGVVYACRAYNGQPRSRKGYVTAVAAGTGVMHWRSPAQTCGGVLDVIGDYVVTGYGENPYDFKLLARSDGRLVQSIRNVGAALNFLVSRDQSEVIIETFKHRITYRLQ
jgi:hypothetical protein